MKVNTDCTIYNTYRNEMTGLIEVRKVHLSGVFWEAGKAVNVISSGLADADAVLVFIPLTVEAEGKQYVDPVGYASLAPEQADLYWTLTEGADYIIRGDAPAVTTQKELKEVLTAFYDSFKISTVDPKLYGSRRLQHWEVSGK